MNCMKCGKEAQPDQAFCDECLAVMAQYPVKPDVVVQLPPKRNLPTEKKNPRKKELTPREALRRQRKLLRKYQIGSLVLLILLGLATTALVYMLYRFTNTFDFIPFLP